MKQCCKVPMLPPGHLGLGLCWSCWGPKVNEMGLFDGVKHSAKCTETLGGGQGHKLSQVLLFFLITLLNFLLC